MTAKLAPSIPNNYTRFLHVGPGGRKCTCCFPGPGTKDRRAQYRLAKRRYRCEIRKLICEEMINDG